MMRWLVILVDGQDIRCEVDDGDAEEILERHSPDVSLVPLDAVIDALRKADIWTDEICPHPRR
jgi:hypothetical protein